MWREWAWVNYRRDLAPRAFCQGWQVKQTQQDADGGVKCRRRENRMRMRGHNWLGRRGVFLEVTTSMFLFTLGFMWLPETFHNESALSVQQSRESTKTGHDIKSSKTLFYFSACISTPSSGGDKRQPTVVRESVNIKWTQAPSHWSLPGWMGSVQARGKRSFINIHSLRSHIRMVIWMTVIWLFF